MKASTSLRRILAATFAAAAAFTGPAMVSAEDIDIFTATPVTNSKPNVLVVLDNSSNWNSTLGPNTCNTGNMADNTKFAAEICALTRVLAAVPDNKLRMGLMMFAESGDNGGYVRFGMRNMDSTNKTALSNMLKGFVANGSGTDNSGSNQPYGKTMEEVFKYFGGYTCPLYASADPGVEACNDMTKKHKTGFGPLAFAGGADNNTGSKRRDYRNNNAAANRAAASYGADNNNAFDSNSSNTYVNPITEDCTKNFVIFISNGNPGTGGDSSTQPANIGTTMTNISATGVPFTGWPNASNELHASKFDEMAYYLHQTDVSPLAGKQNVTVYTIAVYQPTSITYAADGVTVTAESIANPDQPMVALMKSAANLGGGKYFAGRDANSIFRAILEIINEVQAVNSVFVSASLPVSVNNQGTFLNQVYMGMFRPDGSGNPRWLGNLKEYKFVLDATNGSISLGDAKSPSTEAVNPSTGFLSPAAWSYWTRRGNNVNVAGWPNRDFWINNPSGTPATGADALDALHGDGEVVEKGGAAEMLRLDYATAQTSRRVFTCPISGACPAAMNTFDAATITGASFQTAFGATATELPLLVNWIRGADNFNGAPCDPATSGCTWSTREFGPGWPATVRPSIHGDVLHSRPVVINYGPSCPVPLPQPASPRGSCGPWVFYGSNSDGMLHAVKGGQDNSQTQTAPQDGHESWGFLAPEFYSKLKRQRDASPELRTPGTDPSLVAFTLPKDYFFDGPIGVWEDPDSAARWIFVTARRGGRLVYAFDVTDPQDPKFMWKKSSADIPELGQTWSQPFAFKLLDASGAPEADPTLVFGAGYDVDEDLTSPVGGGAVGRGIIVMNARTGALKSGGKVVLGVMKQAEQAGTFITDSVPSDISFLLNTAGVVYRGFFGDTGGNLWRLDIPSGDVSTWRLYKFASQPTGTKRKFFYAPDVVHAGGYDVVLAGTGDREKPLVSTSQDSFYAVNDPNFQTDSAPATMPTPIDLSTLTRLNTTAGITSTTTGATCTGTGTSQVCVCKPPSCKGWYRDLAAGEKVVNSPLTVAGTTFFSTNKPVTSTSVCVNNLGEARAYGFSFFGGTPSQTNPDGTMGQPLTGGGLPPSPVGGVVEIEPGKNVAFIIGAGNKGSSVEGGRITIPVSSTRRKVYWNSAVDK
jgi:type IV pilus assembly protein PilY1